MSDSQGDPVTTSSSDRESQRHSPRSRDVPRGRSLTSRGSPAFSRARTRRGRTPRSRHRRRHRQDVQKKTQRSFWARPGSFDGASDPVKAEFDGQLDLYDIATWERRNAIDSFAISVTNGLRASRSVLLITVALALFLAQAVVAVAIIIEEPLVGVFAISSVLPALAVAGYLWYGDPTRREPFVPLAATFVLSMLFASFAAVINTTFSPVFELLGLLGLILFYFLIVGPIEEFVKWLAIRVYAYRTDAFRTVVDGAVYGAVAGLGFAAIENLIYIVIFYLEADSVAGLGATEAAATVAAQRFFVGPGHVVFSAWAGFYLGLARFNPENRVPIAVKGLLIAAFIHALYNSGVTVLPEFLPVVGLFGFIIGFHAFWFLLLYRKIRAYRELYRATGVIKS